MSQLGFKLCVCGGVASKKVQSVTRKVNDFRFRIHRIPCYKCQNCQQISFDDEMGFSQMSKWIVDHGIRELIWNPSMIDIVKQQQMKMS